VKKGIVVATHPSDHSVDLVLADGRRMVGVQVATPNGSTRSGTFDMPAVPDKADKWDITKLTGQDQIALVDFVGDIPVVVGFLFPQISQMTFDDPKMRVTRHQSDVMSSIDGDGNIQITHPSGTYIRIGETPDKVDMASKNTDASLAADRNTGRKVNIRIGLAGGVLELTMTPDGAVSLKCAKTISIEAGEPVMVKAPAVTLNTPSTTLTGNLDVQGSTTVRAITSNGKNISSTHQHLNSGGPGTGGVPA
jgi:phage baseplate assembly protein gpV